MKKENLLVVVLICLVVVVFFINMGSKSVNNADNDVNATVKVNNEKMDDNAIEQKPDLRAVNASSIDWQSFEKGLKVSKAENKPVFLYFHADWCKYCKMLKNTTFKDKRVLNYLSENFISISVDTEQDKKLAKQWNIKGLPNLWFLKADNSKISNVPGYVKADHFLNILKYISTKSFEKMTFADFLKTI